jgi:DNA primase large subunit
LALHAPSWSTILDAFKKRLEIKMDPSPHFFYYDCFMLSSRFSRLFFNWRGNLLQVAFRSCRVVEIQTIFHSLSGNVDNQFLEKQYDKEFFSQRANKTSSNTPHTR